MLRVPLERIEPGMILARPVPLPDDARRCLLERDREVPRDALPRLRELGVHELWIRRRHLEFLDDVVDENVCLFRREAYRRVRREFEGIARDEAGDLDVDRLRDTVAGLSDALQASDRAGVLLEKFDAFDNFLFSHSANVCYLSLLLGIRLEQYLGEERDGRTVDESDDLLDLGLGCLLHDIGKLRIPPEILNKPGRLTGDEMEMMKLHPVYGYEMVRGRVPAAAAQVVLHHHQRYSGGGYPRRIDTRTGRPLPAMRGRRIPIQSRLATICDVFDAATTRRCYSPAKPPVQALYEMRTWCSGWFDPFVEQAFYEIVPPFPIGQVVALNDGWEAVVVDFNPGFPARPRVQCIRTPAGEEIEDPSLEEIDLAHCDDLSIASVGGVEVTPFLSAYEQPLELELVLA